MSIFKGKAKTLFLSHSSKDSEIVGEILHLFEIIGLHKKTQIFCSSFEGYDIPLAENIYEYLKYELNKNLLGLFIISEDFYDSKYCMCEMGAIWAQSKDSLPLVIPPLSCGNLEPEGILSSIKSGVITEKKTLNKLKDFICTYFNIKKPDNYIWEKYRDEFIAEIIKIIINKYRIPLDFKCYPTKKEYEIEPIIEENGLNEKRFKINFTNNNATWCSSVIHLDSNNRWEWIAKSNSCFHVSLRGSGIKKITVEFKDEHKQRIDRNNNQVSVTDDFKINSLNLLELNENVKRWKIVSEICFVVDKQDVIEGEGYFEINSIEIK